MTAYIITPEQHAQIVDALTQWTTPNWAGSGVDQCNAALSMLKSMKPVEPTFYMSKHQSKPRFYREGETLPTNVIDLYAKEQQ